MLPAFYQKVLRTHLSESQYLTLQLLVLLLQSHRQIQLSRLASQFPQPIHYSSRLRNLQRFLLLPHLSVRLLWFPIVKYWLRQEFKGCSLNRQRRRHLKKLRQTVSGYVVLAVDRTQWQGRNILMVSIVWGTHALPVYWELLNKSGSSGLQRQKRVLKPAIKLLKPYRVLVLADREFHSPKLAMCLSQWKVDFALRQRKSAYIQTDGLEYQPLKDMGFEPTMKGFFEGIYCGKTEPMGPFNLAFYWKRKYRGKGGKEPWYILTSLPTLKQALKLYRCRWGIEMMFKDCKSGGYNLESTKVNDVRFLALVLLMVIAYSLATCCGHMLKKLGIEHYVSRLKEPQRHLPRHSDFGIGLYGYLWRYGMEVWSQLARDLMSLKPHKRLNFQRGLRALSLIQEAL